MEKSGHDFPMHFELYLMDIFDSIDVGLFITDENCMILSINRAFEKVTTIPREELVGKNVQYLLDRDYIANSICREVVSTGTSVTGILHYKNIKKDVIVTGNPVFDDSGKLSFIVCTLKDWDELTALHKELNRVRRKTEEYKEKLDLMLMQHIEDSEFIANDKKTTLMLQMAIRVARGDSAVLLSGESGVGKDMLAKFIHKHSPRASQKGSFVHVN